MKDIAPEIIRQRVLMEGYYTIDVTSDTVREYLLSLAAHLKLKTYGEPIIYSPDIGSGKEINQGFDAFVPLVDSGIAFYVWTNVRFYSIIIYACKKFDENEAVEFTRSYFETKDEMESRSF